MALSYKKQRFKNPHIQEIHRKLKEVFLWKIGRYDDPQELRDVPPDFSYPLSPLKSNMETPSVTWINHSSFLVRFNQIHFLFDPIWSERCSPFSFFGPKRSHPPAIPFSDLPKIDYVLISHDHYDHLDKQTVKALFKKFKDIRWIVPTGVKKRLAQWGIPKSSELSWWKMQVFLLPDGITLKVTAVPSQHFSGRSIWDTNTTLWVGWVLEFYQNQELLKCLYFVGDTGYNPIDFRKIGERFKQIDLSLIPIGTYVPKKFMQAVHVNPLEALHIHRDVHSKLSIGIHWKTFNLSDEARNQPPYDLLYHLAHANIDPSTFLVLEPGHEINW